MKTIYKGSGATVTLYWKIMRGENKVTEDLSNLKSRVFLIGSCNTYSMEPDVVTDEEFGNKVLKVEVDTSILSTGVYDVKAMWEKNDGRNIMKSARTGVFAITDNSEEVGEIKSEEVIRIASYVESIGRDGLSAYEIAVIRGLNNGLSENDWVGNEADRIKAEQERASAETTRKEKEIKRENAEKGRQSGFNTFMEASIQAFDAAQGNRAVDFAAAQGGREAAFTDQIQDFEARFNEAETNRKNGEGRRNQSYAEAENKRDADYATAEANRDKKYGQAEATRNSTIDSKLSDIELRFKDAEDARKTIFNNNEDSRQTNEQYRIQAEGKREKDFQDNEQRREQTFQNNEVARQSNEIKREEQETIRQQSEQARIDTFDENERGRISAENERKQNETQREANEAIRQESYLDKLPVSAVVQETGDSENVVMSQKAVSNALSELGSYTNRHVFHGNDNGDIDTFLIDGVSEDTPVEVILSKTTWNFNNIGLDYAGWSIFYISKYSMDDKFVEYLVIAKKENPEVNKTYQFTLETGYKYKIGFRGNTGESLSLEVRSLKLAQEVGYNTNNAILTGKGDKGVSFKFFSYLPNHRYRIYCKNPNWDVSQLGISPTQHIFELNDIYPDKTFRTRVHVKFEEAGTMQEYYELTAPDGSYDTYLSIYIRANEGERVSFYVEDITNEIADFKKDRNNMFFIGNDDKYVSTKFRGISGHVYKIAPCQSTWGIPNNLVDVSIFYISGNSEETSEKLVSVGYFENLNESYTVEYKNEYDYIAIGGRANFGEKVFFTITDITEISRVSGVQILNFVCVGQNMVTKSFYAQNDSYLRVIFENPSWSKLGITGTDINDFYVYAKNNVGENVKILSHIINSSVVKSYYDIYIPSNIDPDTAKFQVRGKIGEVVNVRIERLSKEHGKLPFKDRMILVGDNNNGVSENILLKKGIEYTVYLPDEAWATDNINLGYVGFIYELWYNDENGASVVVHGIKTNDTYKNKFTFVAPKTTEYTVYIRANDGVKVPIFVIPSSSSYFDKQIEKVRSLGFIRSSTPEGYTPNLVFMHMSDTHCTGDKYREPFEKSIELFNDVSKNVDFILHTGDVRNAEYSDGYDFFYDITNSLSKNIYVTAGNHDVGNGYIVSNAGTDEDVYQQMIAPMLSKWNLKSDGDDAPHTDGKCYYFNDFTEEKIRFIVLYEYETDFDLLNSETLRFHRGYRAFSQEQVNWLIQTLMNTPNDYGVIIAKHQPESIPQITDNPFCSNWTAEREKMQTYCGAELIAQIVQAYIDRTTLNISVEQTGGIVTTLNAVADFSARESSEFICYCSGHTHLDTITRLKNYPNQIELNIGCNNIHYTNGSDINQNGEGVTELLTNVYSIDRNRGYIYIVRLGANFSNTAQYRDFISLKYR